MRVGLIWAEARGGAIGRGGTMPWHLPEDLAHFKRVTLGSPVVMGRRTWESLPESVRPLPGRRNVVVTRNETLRFDGATVAGSLEEALVLAAGGETADSDPESLVWVMGGGELYRAAIGRASVLVVTRIDADVPDADTFAPEIGPEWRLDDRSDERVSRAGLRYSFERWTRD